MNLTPIAGLERRHLHRLQGGGRLALRAVREAVLERNQRRGRTARGAAALESARARGSCTAPSISATAVGCRTVRPRQARFRIRLEEPRSSAASLRPASSRAPPARAVSLSPRLQGGGSGDGHPRPLVAAAPSAPINGVYGTSRPPGAPGDPASPGSGSRGREFEERRGSTSTLNAAVAASRPGGSGGAVWRTR